MKNKKPVKFEKGGLYIAICCCALAIAAVGYFGNKDVDNTEEYAKKIEIEELSDDYENDYSYDSYEPDDEYIADNITVTESDTQEIEENKTVVQKETEEVITPVTVSSTVEIEELKFKMPVDGNVVCEFSGDTMLYNEILSDWRTHNGIDISCDKDAAVFVSADGMVEDVYDDSLGKNVVIEHDGGYKSVYANLSEQIEVSAGESVKKGDLIGKVGTTALSDFTQEPHLHFELLYNDKYINPIDLFE